MTPHSMNPPYSHICYSCAETALQGHKPSGERVFTVHTGICDKCKKEASLGHVQDFGLNEQLEFHDLSPLD